MRVAFLLYQKIFVIHLGDKKGELLLHGRQECWGSL